MEDALQVLLERGLAKNSRLNYTESMVRRFSEGHVWLVGGSVYRTIVQETYGTPVPDDTDLDFVMERLNKTARNNLRDVELPPNATLKSLGDMGEYGNTKLIIDGRESDLWSLEEARFWMNDRSGTIDAYLADVPLTIQSIAYNLDTHELRGPIGIKAIRNCTVEALVPAGAEHYAAKRGMTVEQLISEKKASLGF